MINNPNNKKKVIVTVDDDTAELEVDKDCIRPQVMGLCPGHASHYSHMKDRRIYIVPGKICDSGCDICFKREARIFAVFERLSDKAA